MTTHLLLSILRAWCAYGYITGFVTIATGLIDTFPPRYYHLAILLCGPLIWVCYGVVRLMWRICPEVYRSDGGKGGVR